MLHDSDPLGQMGAHQIIKIRDVLLAKNYCTRASLKQRQTYVTYVLL